MSTSQLRSHSHSHHPASAKPMASTPSPTRSAHHAAAAASPPIPTFTSPAPNGTATKDGPPITSPAVVNLLCMLRNASTGSVDSDKENDRSAGQYTTQHHKTAQNNANSNTTKSSKRSGPLNSALLQSSPAVPSSSGSLGRVLAPLDGNAAAHALQRFGVKSASSTQAGGFAFPQPASSPASAPSASSDVAMEKCPKPAVNSGSAEAHKGKVEQSNHSKPPSSSVLSPAAPESGSAHQEKLAVDALLASFQEPQERPLQRSTSQPSQLTPFNTAAGQYHGHHLPLNPASAPISTASLIPLTRSLSQQSTPLSGMQIPFGFPLSPSFPVSGSGGNAANWTPAPKPLEPFCPKFRSRVKVVVKPIEAILNTMKFSPVETASKTATAADMKEDTEEGKPAAPSVLGNGRRGGKGAKAGRGRAAVPAVKEPADQELRPSSAPDQEHNQRAMLTYTFA